MTFEVLGEPKGKGRPRFTRTGHAYTPETTAAYERQVKLSYLSKGGKRMEGPLYVGIEAVFGIPRSKCKRDKILMEKGEIYPTKKPDTDNIVKIILDGLNGTAYKDDAQVVAVTCQKRFGTVPRVIVNVSAIKGGRNGLE